MNNRLLQISIRLMLLCGLQVAAMPVVYAADASQGTSAAAGSVAVSNQQVVNVDKIDMQLINAARSGRLNEVKALLADGADVNAKTGSGKTVLMGAAYFGNKRIVDTLLAEGADVNAKDSTDSTALIDAAFNGNLDIVKALLAKGADPKLATKTGTTAVQTATIKGNLAAAKLLESAMEDSGGDAKGKKGKKSKKKKK